MARIMEIGNRYDIKNVLMYMTSQYFDEMEDGEVIDGIEIYLKEGTEGYDDKRNNDYEREYSYLEIIVRLTTKKGDVIPFYSGNTTLITWKRTKYGMRRVHSYEFYQYLTGHEDAYNNVERKDEEIRQAVLNSDEYKEKRAKLLSEYESQAIKMRDYLAKEFDGIKITLNLKK